MKKPVNVALDNLLWDLCGAQDTVTHLVESGTIMGLQQAKDERERIMREIKELVLSHSQSVRDTSLPVQYKRGQGKLFKT